MKSKFPNRLNSLFRYSQWSFKRLKLEKQKILFSPATYVIVLKFQRGLARISQGRQCLVLIEMLYLLASFYPFCWHTHVSLLKNTHTHAEGNNHLCASTRAVHAPAQLFFLWFDRDLFVLFICDSFKNVQNNLSVTLKSTATGV